MASTDLAVIEPGLYPALARDLDDIREILQDTIGDDQSLTQFDLPTVKIPSGGVLKWVIPGPMGDQYEDEITGVLLGYKMTRAFWPSQDPTGEPPVCKSDDAKLGTPTEEGAALGAGGACKQCEFAQWGSSPKSENGQACKQSSLWFVLRQDSFLPLVVRLPATSLGAERKYRIGIGSAGKRFTDVVTTLRLRKETNTTGQDYGVADPRMAGALAPEDAAKAKAYAAELKPIFDVAAATVTEEA